MTYSIRPLDADARTADFKSGELALDEYLQRLNLVTVKGGRSLTRDGRRYVEAAFDLRNRISRQG